MQIRPPWRYIFAGGRHNILMDWLALRLLQLIHDRIYLWFVKAFGLYYLYNFRGRRKKQRKLLSANMWSLPSSNKSHSLKFVISRSPTLAWIFMAVRRPWILTARNSKHSNLSPTSYQTSGNWFTSEITSSMGDHFGSRTHLFREKWILMGKRRPANCVPGGRQLCCSLDQ